MKPIVFICLALLGCGQSSSQKLPATSSDIATGGPCEGCEALHESTVALDKLPSLDTLPEFNAGGEKIHIRGTVYKADGKTPAPGVVIYVYHTNAAGIYPTRGDETGWGKRHGYLRGWLKTDQNGAYGFYTTRPGSYPNSSNPQHIHITIKEPGKTAYYIDDFQFDDDPVFTASMRERLRDRGGSGIIVLQQASGIKTGTRNIVLGKNIPGYPG